MSYRTTNILFLIFLITLTLFYLVESAQFVISADDITQNAGFYPLLLSSLLMILCLIKLFQTIKNDTKDKVFKVENLKYILTTLAITIMYIVLWQTFRDMFYIYTFIFYLSLTTIYTWSKKRLDLKNLIKNGVVSISMVVAVYLIFDLIFSIRF